MAALAAAAGLAMEGPGGVKTNLSWMRRKARAARAGAASGSGSGSAESSSAGSLLWVDKYRPSDPDKLVRVCWYVYV